MKPIKNTFLSVFFFLQVLPVFSQDYQPIAIEGAHWFIQADLYYYEPDHHALVVRGDTIINGENYKKLYFQDFANQDPFSPPYLLQDEYLLGALRDDAIERKVYFISFEAYAHGYHCPDGEEHLLYDFSIEVGESTGACLTEEGYPWLMDTFFSIKIYDEDRRTLLNYDQYNFRPEIYEGIGNMDGLLTKLNAFIYTGLSPTSLLDYCIGSDEDCNVIITSTPDLKKELIQIDVFPNPASGFISIKSNEETNQEMSFQIKDPFGRSKFSAIISKGSIDYHYPLKTLSNGIYFYSIITKTGKLIHSGKIIKSN